MEGSDQRMRGAIRANSEVEASYQRKRGAIRTLSPSLSIRVSNCLVPLSVSASLDPSLPRWWRGAIRGRETLLEVEGSNQRQREAIRSGGK